MTVRTRIDTDVIFHDTNGSTFTVGSLSEHLSATPANAAMVSGSVGTAAVQIVGTGPLSTLAVKNTGSGVLRLAGAVDVAAGRVAVLPVTATITVAAVTGTGSYTAVWVGT